MLRGGWAALDVANLSSALHRLSRLAEAAPGGVHAWCRAHLLGSPVWAWLLDNLQPAASSPDFGPQAVANTLAALVRLDALSPALLEALHPPLERALHLTATGASDGQSAAGGGFTSQGLSQVCWALGREPAARPLLLAVKPALFQALTAAAPTLDAQVRALQSADGTAFKRCLSCGVPTAAFLPPNHLPLPGRDIPPCRAWLPPGMGWERRLPTAWPGSWTCGLRPPPCCSAWRRRRAPRPRPWRCRAWRRCVLWWVLVRCLVAAQAACCADSSPPLDPLTYTRMVRAGAERLHKGSAAAVPRRGADAGAGGGRGSQVRKAAGAGIEGEGLLLPAACQALHRLTTEGASCHAIHRRLHTGQEAEPAPAAVGAIVAALGRLGFLPRCHWDPSCGEQRAWVQPLDELGAALAQALPRARPQVRCAWRLAGASASQT